MKDAFKITILPIVLLLIFGAALPSDSIHYRSGKDFALFFAINDYDQWRDLNHPISEAEEIAADLQQHYGFETEIVRNANKREILLKLQEYRQRSYAPDAQLLVFFTGHGFFIDDTEEGFIIPNDGQMRDLIQESYIPHSRLEKAVDNIPCKHILLCIDACFSGTFDEAIASKGSLGQRPNQGKNENDLFIQRSLQYQGRQYLTSGGKEQTPDRSKFAIQLKLALRTFGGADGILTINEIETYLEKVYPIPRSGYFGDHEGGNFLFLTNDNGSGSAVPTPDNEPSTSSRPVDPNGTMYSTKKFNGLTWTTQNLNYPIPGASWCYDDDPANCEKYGRLYTWEGAKKACATLGPGWLLPTDEDWKRLVMDFGGYYDLTTKKDVGDKKKAFNALVEEGSEGFSARLGGYRSANGNFYALGDFGNYWSASESEGGKVWYYGFSRRTGGLVRGNFVKSFGQFCRCVKD